jgi:small subunit ribosomal protein S6e
MKFVVSTKSGKAYSTASEDAMFVGKKVGETVKLDDLGLTGFEAVITGGSDKQGFPMHKSVHGLARKKIFTAKGLGFKKARRGERKRHTVRGNVVSDGISQLNISITKDGPKKIEEILGKKEEVKEETEDNKISAKERAMKAAAASAGSADIGDAPTKKGRH